jgi:putative SOS response-associated peptidase YedK
MPVILEKQDWDQWLFGPDPGALVKPHEGRNLRAYPVDKAVGNPRSQGERLIEPTGPEL